MNIQFKYLYLMKNFRCKYCILYLIVSFTCCTAAKENKTTIEIMDNYRHYYPILTGQELQIMFEIKNTGEHALILTDVIPSCGCITLKKSSVRSIPSGKSGRLMMTYDSSKNIGYVQHYVTLYGNFATSESKEIVFDVNVVPDALYTKDYEELYQTKKDKDLKIKDLTDGKEHQKGYYLSF